MKKDAKAPKFALGEEGLFDASKLGTPRMLVLGIQHLFAMFGATVLVPALTGLSVSSTLLFAGLGTLLFHLLARGKVPAFLGSSFAFLAGYMTIAPNKEPELLPYACLGVAFAGLLYVILAVLIKAFGARKVMRFFPPIVTGPIIIAIAVVIVCNIWGKGMIKIVPILAGVIVSYIVAAFAGQVNFDAVREAAWFGLPFKGSETVFSLFGNMDKTLALSAIITIVPISLATMVEHIGDICAISSTTGRNYIADPGLHRTLLGDGLATTLAALFGAPANTTYGENTGVLALTRVFDPRVVRIAAYGAILLSFSPKFAAVIAVMPPAVIGGVSLVLYGMISAIGVRNIVENKVDFTRSRNVIIAALILVLAIGVAFSAAGAIVIHAGAVTISLSGLAIAAIVGILLNALLPGNDYVFDTEDTKPKYGTYKV